MDEDLLAQHLLESFPNPQRIGCPDDDMLVDLAEGRRLGDEATLAHIGRCSECFRQYRHYRLDWLEDQVGASKNAAVGLHVVAKPLIEMPAAAAPAEPLRDPEDGGRVPSKFQYKQYAIAASLLVAVLGTGIFVYERHRSNGTQTITTASSSKPPIVELPPASEPVGTEPAPEGEEQSVTIDLSRHDQEAAEKPSIASLRAARVRIHVILPRHSRAGAYSIVVSRDSVGSQVLARAKASATRKNGRVHLNTDLDLQEARSGGAYLLISSIALGDLYHEAKTYTLKIR